MTVGPELEVARRSFRRTWIGAAVCAVVFGATAASSALTYVQSFPDAASRRQLVTVTAGDAGLAVLLGPVGEVGTVGGYTFYKGFVFLTTIGAVWAVLAATRTLRGEEDTGRWQLVLAGGTRPARATAAVCSAILCAVGVIGVGTWLLTWAAGLDPDVGFGAADALVYAASIALVPAVFGMAGAVTSQLGRSRRVATGLGMAVVAVAFAIRMLADASPSTAWLRWLTPFGWSERMSPFTGDDLLPLVPAVLSVVGLGLLAALLAGRRDVGGGVLASNDTARPRARGLGSATALAARLDRWVALAWWIGALATGLVLGVIAQLTSSSIPDSFRETLDRFGVEGSFATQYFGVAFLLVAVVVALVPAGQIGAAAEEETRGRIVHVLAAGTRRSVWLAGRLAIAAAVVLVAGLLAGIGTWIGATVQGVDVAAATLVGAGLNVVPTALLALGFGAVVFAVAPRLAAGAVYVLVAWSLVGDLFASLVDGLAWVRRTTLLGYLALAPAERVDLVQVGLQLAVAVALCAVAVALFERRDLAT